MLYVTSCFYSLFSHREDIPGGSAHHQRCHDGPPRAVITVLFHVDSNPVDVFERRPLAPLQALWHARTLEGRYGRRTLGGCLLTLLTMMYTRGNELPLYPTHARHTQQHQRQRTHHEGELTHCT